MYACVDICRCFWAGLGAVRRYEAPAQLSSGCARSRNSGLPNSCRSYDANCHRRTLCPQSSNMISDEFFQKGLGYMDSKELQPAWTGTRPQLETKNPENRRDDAHLSVQKPHVCRKTLYAPRGSAGQSKPPHTACRGLGFAAPTTGISRVLRRSRGLGFATVSR